MSRPLPARLQGTTAAQGVRAGSFLVVGTGFVSPRSEESPGAGRLLVFAVIAAAPGGGGGEDGPAWRLHLVSENRVDAPVVCLAPLLVPATAGAPERHHALAGCGRALTVFEWHHRAAEGRYELREIARHDGAVLVRSLAVVSVPVLVRGAPVPACFVLAADAYGGTTFLRVRGRSVGLRRCQCYAALSPLTS